MTELLLIIIISIIVFIAGIIGIWWIEKGERKEKFELTDEQQVELERIKNNRQTKWTLRIVVSMFIILFLKLGWTIYDDPDKWIIKQPPTPSVGYRTLNGSVLSIKFGNFNIAVEGTGGVDGGYNVSSIIIVDDNICTSDEIGGAVGSKIGLAIRPIMSLEEALDRLRYDGIYEYAQQIGDTTFWVRTITMFIKQDIVNVDLVRNVNNE